MLRLLSSPVRHFSRQTSVLLADAPKAGTAAGSGTLKHFVFTQQPPGTPGTPGTPGNPGNPGNPATPGGLGTPDTPPKAQTFAVGSDGRALDLSDRHHHHSNQKENYLLFQPVYTFEEVNNVKVTHVKPVAILDKVAYVALSTIRIVFDFFTGYKRRQFHANDFLNRIVFLETVAGVPGMVGGMHRHMKSLRTMNRDRGWVHTLLEEAENERMHLLSYLKLKKPGPLFRFMVLMTQGVVFNLYFLFYWVSPKYCHRFVGFLEEQAVITYTHVLHEIDNGVLAEWRTTPAPDIAKEYWRLGPNGTVRDMVLATRADEANHRDVNHRLADIKASDPNPYSPPADELPKA